MDWSVDPRKRFLALATLRRGRYVLDAPRLAAIDELLDLVCAPGSLAGFDFPLGVPHAYARRAGVSSFPAWLSELGRGRFADAFEVAAHPSEISLGRPFYPRRPGGTRRAQLVAALGMTSPSDLLRRCDTASGRAACAIFWTLGGNQVGKAALAGWRDVVRPAVARGARLWPFDGDLAELVASGAPALFETYPADAYAYVGATLPTVEGKRGKRWAPSRRASAPSMEAAAASLGVRLTASAAAALASGFGDDAEGEDRFDAFVGALGMIAVATGLRSEGLPDDPAVRAVEGWILGRAPAPTDPLVAPRGSPARGDRHGVGRGPSPPPRRPRRGA